ncbi:MAG: methyltransferase domain-containing protein [Rhodobacter sp.]|nr:methyltransferase domain-containing protein [Rhodobacter sp.]
MQKSVPNHYSGGGGLADKIADALRKNGVELKELRAADLEAVDEFHFRGREATLELLAQMNLEPNSRVLDIGSGLGGVARTFAEKVGCHVTGVDLTQELCDAATTMSVWVNLGDRTEFIQGDATNLPFLDNQFDGAVTVHVAMNIPDKKKMYSEARRVLKPGAIFAIYDILQGEGGEVLYPAPWASESSISHLVTPREMSENLCSAGFRILHEVDSTSESFLWLKERTERPKLSNSPPVTTQLLFGNTSREMTHNQLLGLRERRMLTYSVICAA